MKNGTRVVQVVSMGLRGAKDKLKTEPAIYEPCWLTFDREVKQSDLSPGDLRKERLLEYDGYSV